MFFPIESAFEAYPAHWLYEIDYMHHNEGIKYAVIED